MIEVIPAINVKTWDEVVRKIRAVESFVDWVHVDVADGTFTPNAIWHNPMDLVGFKTKCKIEIHLMEDRAEERIHAWLVKPVSRVIVHYETTHDIEHIVRECKADGIESGLAIAPQTSWTVLKPYVEQVDLLQVLAVPPGHAGQRFDKHVLSKVKHLRAGYPPARIEVDGGIDPVVARECVKAGANILASASYIFNHPSPKMAIAELKNF